MGVRSPLGDSRNILSSPHFIDASSLRGRSMEHRGAQSFVPRGAIPPPFPGPASLPTHQIKEWSLWTLGTCPVPHGRQRTCGPMRHACYFMATWQYIGYKFSVLGLAKTFKSCCWLSSKLTHSNICISRSGLCTVYDFMVLAWNQNGTCSVLQESPMVNEGKFLVLKVSDVFCCNGCFTYAFIRCTWCSPCKLIYLFKLTQCACIPLASAKEL